LLVLAGLGIFRTSAMVLVLFGDSMAVEERHFQTYQEAAKSGLVGEGRLRRWVPISASYIHVRADAAHQ
jgi:hypothetical protein